MINSLIIQRFSNALQYKTENGGAYTPMANRREEDFTFLSLLSKSWKKSMCECVHF